MRRRPTAATAARAERVRDVHVADVGSVSRARGSHGVVIRCPRLAADGAAVRAYSRVQACCSSTGHPSLSLSLSPWSDASPRRAARCTFLFTRPMVGDARDRRRDMSAGCTAAAHGGGSCHGEDVGLGAPRPGDGTPRGRRALINHPSGMGSSRRSGSSGSRANAGVLKERANMSFMLVVMFFAVFGLIVLTEIFLIDERRGVSIGGTGILGGHRSGHRLPAAPDRPDYGEVGAEDYAGLKGSFDEHVGLLVHGEDGGQKTVIHPDPRGLPSLPPSLEARLPQLDQNLKVTHAEWLPVTNTRFKFFVYSAYFDNRVSGAGTPAGKSQGVVRVISATKTRGPERVWCRLWYRQQNGANVTASVTVAAKVKVIRENWNLKYSACFVICPLPKESPTTDKVPEAVSVVARLRAVPTNRILVQNRFESRTNDREALAVCVKPLHYYYNRVLQLVEFIELHRLLGATHVTLYNDTVGAAAGCALKYYENKDLVTVLPWHHLDMISQREIRTEGLFAALNDCLYRSMYKYEYVALVDLDEYIIPRHNDTIIDLLRWMGNRINIKSTGAFSFQNAFFYLQWADDPFVVTSRTPTEAGLITLKKTRRRTKLHPHKQRSKYICKPQDVVEAGNHFVWEFIPGHGTLNVPSDAAILHHYRVCEFGGDDCIKTQSTVDRTAYKYRERLATNVDKTWMELRAECSLPELDPVPALTPRIKASPLGKSVR